MTSLVCFGNVLGHSVLKYSHTTVGVRGKLLPDFTQSKHFEKGSEVPTQDEHGVTKGLTS